MRVSLLNLHLYFPKDVRKLIYKKLTFVEILLVFWAHKRKKILTLKEMDNITSYAARNGYIELAKLVLPKGSTLHHTAWYVSIQYGQLNFLKWLSSYTRCNDVLLGVPTKHAAKFGQLPVLIWLKSIGFICNYKTFRTAARYGHLHILQWLVSCGYVALGQYNVWDHYGCLDALRKGHNHIVKWILNNCDEHYYVSLTIELPMTDAERTIIENYYSDACTLRNNRLE